MVGTVAALREPRTNGETMQDSTRRVDSAAGQDAPAPGSTGLGSGLGRRGTQRSSKSGDGRKEAPGVGARVAGGWGHVRSWPRGKGQVPGCNPAVQQGSAHVRAGAGSSPPLDVGQGGLCFGAGSSVMSQGLVTYSPGQTWERLSPSYFLFNSAPRNQHRGPLEKPVPRGWESDPSSRELTDRRKPPFRDSLDRALKAGVDQMPRRSGHSALGFLFRLTGTNHSSVFGLLWSGRFWGDLGG